MDHLDPQICYVMIQQVIRPPVWLALKKVVKTYIHYYKQKYSNLLIYKLLSNVDVFM